MKHTGTIEIECGEVEMENILLIMTINIMMKLLEITKVSWLTIVIINVSLISGFTVTTYLLHKFGG